MKIALSGLSEAALVAGLVIGVHVIAASAQSPRPAPTPQQSTNTYSPKDGAFTIAIDVNKPEIHPDDGKDFDETTYVFDMAAGSVYIDQTDFDHPMSDADIDAKINSIVEERRTNPGNSVSDIKPVTLNGFRGKSLYISADGYGFIELFVAKDTRLFQITCQYKFGRNPGDKAALQKVLDSFAPATPVAAAATTPLLPGPEGTKYVSPDGRFTLMIPGQPVIKREDNGDTTYTWDLNRSTFQIQARPVPRPLTADERIAILRKIQDQADAEHDRPSYLLPFYWYTLLTYSRLKPNGELKEIFIPTPNQVFAIHFFGPPYEEAYWRRAETYWNSFAIKSDGESDYKLAFERNKGQ